MKNYFTQAYNSVKNGLNTAYNFGVETTKEASNRVHMAYKNAKLFTEMDFDKQQEVVKGQLKEGMTSVKETVDKTSKSAIETLEAIKDFFTNLNPKSWFSSLFKFIGNLFSSLFNGICSIFGINKENKETTVDEGIELKNVAKKEHPSSKEFREIGVNTDEPFTPVKAGTIPHEQDESSYLDKVANVVSMLSPLSPLYEDYDHENNDPNHHHYNKSSDFYDNFSL